MWMSRVRCPVRPVTALVLHRSKCTRHKNWRSLPMKFRIIDGQLDFESRALRSTVIHQHKSIENQRLSSFFSVHECICFRYNWHKIDTLPHLKERWHLESGFCSFL